MTNTTFGQLVKAYRMQRGWTQAQVAERWEYTAAYVSEIERGKRKLQGIEQVQKLADILEIPYHKLPPGKLLLSEKENAVSVGQADEQLLQALLAPATATVKLSWLVWFGDGNMGMENDLQQLVTRLEEAVSTRQGKYLHSALKLLALSHQMLGKIHFDQLNYVLASGHFQEMQDIGHELKDNEIIALSLIHQGDMLRKRGRIELGIRALDAAQSFAHASNICVQGVRWQTLARAYAASGQKALFLDAIDRAEDAANNIDEQNLDSLCQQFNSIEARQERGQGHTVLWEPAQALEIYKEIEPLKPFRPVRDLGSYTILKAQAYAYAGDITTGVNLALQGIQLAKSYGSRRHLKRIKIMGERLSISKEGKSNPAELTKLREALEV